MVGREKVDDVGKVTRRKVTLYLEGAGRRSRDQFRFCHAPFP